jgi:ATP-dependent Zn protease
VSVARTALVVLLVAGPALAVTAKQESLYFEYAEFIEEVDAGRVVSVSLRDQGDAIEGVVRHDGEEQVFRTSRPDAALEDTLLKRLLTAHDVRIEPQAPQEIGALGMIAFMGVFSFFAPFATLVLVIAVNRRLARLEKTLTDRTASGSFSG